MGPKYNDSCPYKKKGHREEGHVKTKAEIRVRLPQAKKSLETPETERGKAGVSLRASRRG